MTRAMLLLVVATGTLIACGDSSETGDPPRPPNVTFNGSALIGGALDPELLTAWEDARSNPDGGLSYSFAVETTGLPEGTRIDLVMARNLGLFVNGVPVTDADYTVQTTTSRSDGSATFDPPGVATGNWAIEDSAVPAVLLCGETLVLARAMDPSGSTVVASTYLLVVTPSCP